LNPSKKAQRMARQGNILALGLTLLLALGVSSGKAGDWGEGVVFDFPGDWQRAYEIEVDGLLGLEYSEEERGDLSWLEQLSLQASDTLWLPGHEGRSAFIVAYVPAGQSVQDWSEMVTVQALDNRETDFFPQLGATVRTLKAYMLGRCRNLNWGTVSELSDRVLYDWSIRNCPPYPDQHGVAVLRKGDSTVFRVGYTRRGSIAPWARERRKWQAILDSVEIVPLE